MKPIDYSKYVGLENESPDCYQQLDQLDIPWELYKTSRPMEFLVNKIIELYGKGL